MKRPHRHINNPGYLLGSIPNKNQFWDSHNQKKHIPRLKE